MSSSKIFLFSCLSFIIGIFSALILQKAQLTLLGLSFLSALGFSFLPRNRKFRWPVIFCLAFFVLGFIRGNFALMKIADNKLQNFNGSQVTLEGIVDKEPEIVQKNQKLVIKIGRIVRGPSSGDSPRGSPRGPASGMEEKILVYAPSYPQYHYADRLQISGLLEEPPIFDSFDYKQYLAQRGIYSIIFSPKIEILAKPEDVGVGVRIYKKILGLKSKLRASLEQNFPSSQSLLLGAIILGDKSRLSEELKAVLNKAGIRHLTAISGMHITILVNLLMLLFLGLGFWRKQAFLLTTAFILFFVIMTGCQPSTIRASIMGFLFLLGQILGRSSDSSRTIIFGAALMLAFNPLFLAQAGFQLSFLAVMGINYLTPIFSRWLRKIPNPIQMRNILAMSLSAQVFTLPILIYNFGYISLVAPMTNLLVLPLLPFIIVLGFLAALAGIFSHLAALIFVFPCWLLLSYLLKVADIFSSLTFSSINLKISWLWLIIFYLFLAYLIWRWKKDHRFKILGF